MKTLDIHDYTPTLADGAVLIARDGDTVTIYELGDALPVPPPETLSQAQDRICRAIDAHATALRNAATDGIAPAEMAAWPIKRAEAARFAETGDAADAPILAAEAVARGVPLASIAARVQSNAAQLAMLEAAIAGTAGRHRDAVRAMTTSGDVLDYDWQAGWPGI